MPISMFSTLYKSNFLGGPAWYYMKLHMVVRMAFQALWCYRHCRHYSMALLRVTPRHSTYRPTHHTSLDTCIHVSTQQ